MAALRILSPHLCSSLLLKSFPEIAIVFTAILSYVGLLDFHMMIFFPNFHCFPCDSGADLSDADLRGADFSLASVTKVIFG